LARWRASSLLTCLLSICPACQWPPWFLQINSHSPLSCAFPPGFSSSLPLIIA
jgi:hypothetical protein